MATLEEVNKIMVFLSTIFPRHKYGAATIKAYHMILKDIPVDALTSSAEKLAGENTFYPAVAELRQMAFDLLEDDSLPLPMECWQQLIDSWGGRGVEFHQLTVKTINAMGGTRRLGQTLDKDMPYLRAQFLKVCDTYRKRVVDDRRQLPSVKEFKKLNAANVARVDAGIKKLLEGKRVETPPEAELPY